MKLTKRAALPIVVALAMISTIAACGSTEEDVRNFLSDNYELVNESGKYEQYHADESATDVAVAVSKEVSPGRQHEDNGEHYLGYKDLMLHVADDPNGGSEIEVTDPRDGYDRWGVAIIPIWGTYGGSYRGSFSGGGSGGGGK